MKFYFLDDDNNILNLLNIIIKDRNLGDVVGSDTSPLSALSEVSMLKPDIIIVDFLMKEMDGVTFIKKAKKHVPNASFIMLSQVSSKEMIGSAYEAGIEFFINKPLNSIEVESVIKNVQNHIETSQKLQKVQEILHVDTTENISPSNEPVNNTMTPEERNRLLNLLQTLGMAGEKGAQDIVLIVDHLLTTNTTIGSQPLKELCSEFTDMPKSMEQRIRRAASTGLSNVAYMGLDDYGNPIFEQYAAMLFGFEQVRKEMDYIEGKADKHGVVKIRNFLNSITHYCRR